MNKPNINKITSNIEQSKPKQPSEESALHAGGLVVKESVLAYEKHNPVNLTQDRHEKGQDDKYTSDTRAKSKSERRKAKTETSQQLLETQADTILVNAGFPELAAYSGAEQSHKVYDSDWWWHRDDDEVLATIEHVNGADVIHIPVSNSEDSVGHAIAVRRIHQTKKRKGTDPVNYYEGPYPDQDIVTDIIH